MNISADVKQNGEAKSIEILLPIEAAEGAQIEANQFVHSGVITNGTMDVSIG